MQPIQPNGCQNGHSVSPLVMMPSWSQAHACVAPKQLFELFEMFIKHVSVLGSETVSEQSTEIGLCDKHVYVWQLKLRLYVFTVWSSKSSLFDVSQKDWVNITFLRVTGAGVTNVGRCLVVQPVVQPVWQPVGQPDASCKRVPFSFTFRCLATPCCAWCPTAWLAGV